MWEFLLSSLHFAHVCWLVNIPFLDRPNLRVVSDTLSRNVGNQTPFHTA
jgi:hypothetical protein